MEDASRRRDGPRRWGALALLLLAALLGRAALAQPAIPDLPAPDTAATSGPSPNGEAAPAATPSAEQRLAAEAARIAAEREAVQAEIEALRTKLAELAPAAELRPDAAGAVREELDLLEQIDRTLARQEAALQRAEQLEQAGSQLELRVAAGGQGPIAQPPPYPIALADAVASAAHQQAERRRTIEAAVKAAEEQLAAAEEQLARRETARRLAKEAAEQAADPVAQVEKARSARRAELESRLGRARRDLARLELANARRELELQRGTEQAARATLEWIESNLALDRGELNEILARLDKRAFDVKRELDEASQNLELAEKRLAAVEKRVAAAGEPDEALQAELEARKLELRAAQRRAVLLAEELERIGEARTLWERRYATLAGQAPRQELLTWQEEIERSLEEAGRARRLLEARLAELRSDLEALRARRSAASPAAARWLERQERALLGLVRDHERELASLDEHETLAARTHDMIAERTARASWQERLRDAWMAISGGWGTELIAVDDRPITVGKIVTAILLFGIGLLFSRLASRALGRIFLRRLRLDEGAVHAIEGLAFYVLLVLFFLFALRTVNIPLTAFTVLGGALAIGVGFGSQNIVNNFISGLILMAERPIKVGDIIELDGVQGRVERIGGRSTRIRRFDNIHMIVPNSHFLEQRVVNWTLSDDVIRTEVLVGVAYGSPTREVEEALEQVLEEHPRILDAPAPNVFFADFGDSALVFRCTLWIRVRDVTERRRVESDVRYRIDEEFRRRNIVIAFPQRDVHLDAPRPFPVQIVAPEPPAPDEPGEESS